VFRHLAKVFFHGVLRPLSSRASMMNDTPESGQSDRRVAGERPQGEADANTQSRGERETVPPSKPWPESGAAGPIPAQFGRYRIVRELGEGGMGSVYLAEDTELERQVALKIPKFAQQEEPDLLERFYREARAAATLNHPNICQVHDIGEHQGTRYITMAYVSGPPLSQLVGSPKVRSERTIARLVRKIALGLSAAHSKGVLHRDLKPGNILLDERNEPVITDFGLARRVEQNVENRLTQEGVLLGTPAYMSPEQIGVEAARMGPASDVYSLGVILYELLTGELPYQGPIAAVLGQIIDGNPKPPSELRPGLNSRMEAICLKMMACSVNDRYSSGGEVAAALSHYLEQTAAQAKTGAVRASDAEAKLEEHKEHTIRLLKEGKFNEAAARLQKLAKVQGAGAEPYVEWANGELDRLKAIPTEVRDKGPAIMETAIELVASHDYAQAGRLLRAVPDDFRSPEATKLLDKVTKLEQETERLNARMHQAVAARQYDGLQDDLNRLLEIQPGNLTARELRVKLMTYSPGQPYLFDGSGNLIPAPRKSRHRRVPILPVAIGLGTVALVLIAFLVFKPDDGKSHKEDLPERRPEPPLERGFVSLFEGKTLDEWQGASENFHVENGLLVSDFPEKPADGNVPSLLTVSTYDDFILRLDFRLQPGANSGILIRAPSGQSNFKNWMEIQVVDDFDARYAETISRLPTQRTGSLSVVAPAQPGKLKAAGTWNHMEIRCLGRELRVQLNGASVLDVSLDSFGQKSVRGEDMPGLLRTQGHIGLIGPSSSGRVEYRNILVEKLNGIQPPKPTSAPFGGMEAKKHQQEWADYLGVSTETGKSVGMKMVLIPPGDFDMGSPEEFIEQCIERTRQGEMKWDRDHYARLYASEGPQHRVRITRPFWMAKHEVTVGQFRQFVDATEYKTEAELSDENTLSWREPGLEQNDDHPVVVIGWTDATHFCQWLTSTTGDRYRLPTEAEWEYACRAGTTTAYYFGDAHFGEDEDPDQIRWQHVWWSKNSSGATHPVGQKQPNPWGLFDVHGNADEWCSDWYGEHYYGESPPEDPTGPVLGEYHVYRGGSWLPGVQRSAFRNYLIDKRAERLCRACGFRVVCEIPTGTMTAAE
jgi:formylglycine-generating enzyme required for sulfatase activity